MQHQLQTYILFYHFPLTNNYQNLQYLAGERLADVAKYMKENETLRSENNKLKLLLADRELAKNFNEEKK
jgi:regulator of replication initiation timing